MSRICGSVWALGAVGVLAAVGAARRRGRGSRWKSDPRVELYDESSPDSYNYDYVWEVTVEGKWKPMSDYYESETFFVFTDNENFDAADAQNVAEGYVDSEFFYERPVEMQFAHGQSDARLVKKPSRRRSLRGAR